CPQPSAPRISPEVGTPVPAVTQLGSPDIKQAHLGDLSRYGYQPPAVATAAVRSPPAPLCP
ncbi:hypothetical protein, partial [Streptomyces sp. NPDC023588]|uniref:hypothetical protein n=1 Tax=Streptomyces sp. NPDC023588 TaxID=3154907 RepID=UPI0033DB67CB